MSDVLDEAKALMADADDDDAVFADAAYELIQKLIAEIERLRAKCAAE